MAGAILLRSRPSGPAQGPQAHLQHDGVVGRDVAVGLGELLAREKITLVYGGGGVGLMGLLANAALKAGGRVTGIIPRFLLQREAGHPALSETVVVETMHERKLQMF